jgi:hypothetical protein
VAQEEHPAATGAKLQLTHLQKPAIIPLVFSSSPTRRTGCDNGLASRYNVVSLCAVNPTRFSNPSSSIKVFDPISSHSVTQ